MDKAGGNFNASPEFLLQNIIIIADQITLLFPGVIIIIKKNDVDKFHRAVFFPVNCQYKENPKTREICS
ncbi:hypothetical protein [Pseudenterobacter timonensis]|uniref:hypothetical protein n=1 Tax=Pseudenterobacter timonensis TaxID=1755099 RepID=UPI002877F215|nr:hypothetical protein [Pseudenterobacter timonensis]